MPATPYQPPTITYAMKTPGIDSVGFVNDPPTYDDFNVTASSSPLVYPLGWYDGWCIDRSTSIYTTLTYTAKVYSSYEYNILRANANLATVGDNGAPLLPGLVATVPTDGTSQPYLENLDVINWLLNNLVVDSSHTYNDTINGIGYTNIPYYIVSGNPGLGLFTYGDIQQAIYQLLGDGWSTNKFIGLDSQADVTTLVNHALQQVALEPGGIYVPDLGEKIVVILDNGINPADGKVFQPTIITTLAAKLGDYVWHDLNADGLQNDGDTGINGATVTLWRDLDGNGVFDPATELLGVTVTGDDPNTTGTQSGYYEFKGLTPGLEYQVLFATPTGFDASSPRQVSGADPANVVGDNSDGLVSNKIYLSPGEFNRTIDAGFYKFASIGDRVWLDCDGDGIQDANEAGVNGVTVNLLDGSGQVVSTQKTQGDGNYLFSGLIPGNYSIEVVKPGGYSFTLRDQGNDDAVDSDVDAQTGKTAVTTLTSGEEDLSWDAGLITTCGVCVDIDLTCNTNSGGTGAGNIRTVSQNGVSARISAFSRTDADGAWKTAYLGSYSGGLGVTDTSEDGSSPSHAVDNVGGRDNYILFEFDRAVVLDSAFLGWVSGDSDMQVWIGTANNPYANHLTLSDTLLSGMFTEVNDTTLSSTRWADVNGGGLAGNVVIIAASTADTTPEDYFKVQKLDLCTPACGLTASIGDRIWYDNNANGIQDSGEGGVAGVRIDLMDGSNVKVASTTTDSNGNYLFANLAPGQYQVNIDETTLPTAYVFTGSNKGSNDATDSDIIDTATYPKSYGRMEVTTLTAGENDLSWDAGITRQACVGDRVWEDKNHNWIQDSTEPGIGGIKVKLYNLGADGKVGTDDQIVASTTTSSTGYYKFTVDPGTYYVVFDKANVMYNGINMNTWLWAYKDVGSNDAVDSDAGFTQGQARDYSNVTKTGTFTLKAGDNDMTRDAGLTPIVIDLDGGGIQTVSRSESTGRFDLFGNGSAVESGWIGSGEGFLAVDKSGNGRIDSISELFGGTAKGAGFAQLADYDSNGDGLVNADDAGFADLRIWRDANGNHQTDDGELLTLAEAGVRDLKVNYTDMPFLDRQGNLHLERSSATLDDGRTADMTDVYFAVDAEDAAAAGVDLPGLAALLDDLSVAPATDAGWLFA